MSRAAISVTVWGIYMLAMGTTFLLIPNLALPLFGFPPSDEVWIRIVAMFAMVLGYFYIQTARQEMRPFFYWKVHGHFFGVVCMALFVILQWGPPNLLLFAAADLLAAIWTGWALRHPGLATPAPA
jgi:hypothetical protein